MNLGRRLRPVERMVRVADEAYTLNFATCALLEGNLETPQLRAALAALVRRHPLLGAAVEADHLRMRGVPIELVESGASIEAVDALLEGELRHRRWPSQGPRARCLVVRHTDQLTTLILAFDHLVSDGSSGVLAMRDLLRLLASREAEMEPLPSPGMDVFFPAGRGGAKDFVASLAYTGRKNQLQKPFRLRRGNDVGPDERVLRIHRSRFSRHETERMLGYAKRAGATMHGLLVAALSLAIAEESGRDGGVPIRVMHPVDMRRYLDTLPGAGSIGEAIGYYVSSVETDHLVDRGTNAATLSSEVTRAVRSAKERGEPFYTAPTGGRLLVLARTLLGAERFRAVAEAALVPSTFSITNLGPLEKLGLERRYGPLRIREFGFVASPSIFGSFCASASTFDGELELVLHHVEPFVDASKAERIGARVATTLRQAVEA